VEAHGGRIEFESNPGKGTIFTVKLPMSSENPVENGSEKIASLVV
jgi:signal transduction histidine kinase